MSSEPAFLGTGWSFPPAFSAGGQEVAMVSGGDDIRQSLEILLATHAAERPFHNGYGCDLRQFMYEEMDQGLLNRLTGLISDAVLMHEPRVILNRVDIDAPEREAAAGLLLIRLDYTIRGTNSRHNLVYPFYLNEASAPPA
jgi:phage baseplate assembly protein W